MTTASPIAARLRPATLPSDLAVWDGHIAMIVGNVDDDRSQLSIGFRLAAVPVVLVAGLWSALGLPRWLRFGSSTLSAWPCPALRGIGQTADDGRSVDLV